MQIGFHTSISGGLNQPFEQAIDFGANTLQVFSKSPRNWSLPQYSQQEFEKWKEARQQTKIKWGIVHSIYLVNLGKPPQEAIKDQKAVLFDLYFGDQLGFDFVNTHLGKSAGKRTTKQTMENMKKNIEEILQKASEHNLKPQFLRENTAGQWSEIWWDFDQLKEFHHGYMQGLPIGYCLDTAHLRGAWRDIGNWEEILSRLDEAIGVKNIKAIHLNDSKAPLGSRLDRHANLWYWFIGWEKLLKVRDWAVKNDLLVIIETPDSSLRSQELEFLTRATKWDLSWLAQQQKNFQKNILKKFENLV